MRILALASMGITVAAHDEVMTLDGSGTTNPSKFYWEIMSRFEARARPPVKMTYRAVGSSTGQFEFMGADQGYVAFNDFGSGDMPFSKDNYDALNAAGVNVLHVPFSLGAMAFFHNVPDAAQPTAGVHMTACILADVFNGVITTWDHANILAVNSGFAPPAGQPITVHHRTYGSSTTKGITQYLHAACPDKWSADMVGSTIDWPASTVAVEGSGEMSSAISSTEYSIGYIDSGHGIEDGLHEVSLMNKDGYYQTTTEAIAAGGVQAAAAEALALGVMPSDPAEDFSEVSLHNMPGETTWPIVAISYLYVRADQSANEEKGPLLKAFIEYVLSEEGQALLGNYNFEGAPAAVLAVSRKAHDAITADDAFPTWTFETDTDKGGGQADHVISAKRRSHYEYAIGELESTIASTEFGSCDCASSPASHTETTIHTTIEVEGKNEGDQDDDIDFALKIAEAGLVVAALALLVAIVACVKVNKLLTNRDHGMLKDVGEVCLPSKASSQAYSDLELTKNGNGNGQHNI